MYVCMCVCKNIHVIICVYYSMYEYVCMIICTNVCMLISSEYKCTVCMYVCILHMHVCMHANVHTFLEHMVLFYCSTV